MLNDIEYKYFHNCKPLGIEVIKNFLYCTFLENMAYLYTGVWRIFNLYIRNKCETMGMIIYLLSKYFLNYN